ncbi:MAG TPA: alcohol dehydrogenase catalytic domain-containing protein [Clostridia bacterium]|nr:alcohol dehydrogenase catalytic domain-containing protein [Clostridia bacterium]
MKAAFVKSPFQFEIREVRLREITDDEVLVKVKACGICGSDTHTAETLADDWRPFGHEIAGIVEKTGKNIRNVKPGQSVVLESGSFCRECTLCRNGRVDLCNDAPNIFSYQTMGFAEYIIAPKECVVPFDGLSFAEASLTEPLGVALDLFYSTDIQLNDDVLVIGLGPIGLMALRLAKLCGARNVYGAARSYSEARIELAKKFGASDVILTDKQDIKDFEFPRGGVEKIMITASPATIPDSFEAALNGGIISFLGEDFGEGADISFNANYFHWKKLQLRSSYAAPALYFPRCIELIKSGAVDAKALISHTFGLKEIAGAMETVKNDKKHVLKSVMLQD